jgi:hypothetical protein
MNELFQRQETNKLAGVVINSIESNAKVDM